jgi:hypothetical protein
MYSSAHSLTSSVGRGEWLVSRPGRFELLFYAVSYIARFVEILMRITGVAQSV